MTAVPGRVQRGDGEVSNTLFTSAIRVVFPDGTGALLESLGYQYDVNEQVPVVRMLGALPSGQQAMVEEWASQQRLPGMESRYSVMMLLLLHAAQRGHGLTVGQVVSRIVEARSAIGILLQSES